MNPIIYATTNIDKFNKANVNLNPFGVSLVHERFEMQEIQTADGEKIVKDKAQQAYKHFQQPVLVNDDSWIIPALNGFPSTGMKLCNDYLVAEDWLRLMSGIDDRRIYMDSYYAFHDGNSVSVLVNRSERYFLHEPRGKHKDAPSLEVIANVGSTTSIAEEITAGRKVDKSNMDFWKKLSDLLRMN
jgi:inosine/xanthosine triphosphate pyrophosphatase family protein